MRKLVIGAVLGFGMVLLSAAPASAEGYVYTGKWYPTAAACEKAWSDAHGGGPSLGHQCRHTGAGVYELWAYQL
ncbi:hypothetical protein [Pseudonocardia sp. HH130630-07]|uniref:hypothetical protein n=1 Tax=Pseudonocardia sp. HH130630-07 TaxID=1690815 RepID=UPI000814C5E9|nr:hypothetical protein [Pseudonocardia sp. HH130630-07]ANY08309.1 hypothetical protein AFB00_20800 [Pseudonocardia sp. HH130630-07]